MKVAAAGRVVVAAAVTLALSTPLQRLWLDVLTLCVSPLEHSSALSSPAQ